MGAREGVREKTLPPPPPTLRVWRGAMRRDAEVAMFDDQVGFGGVF